MVGQHGPESTDGDNEWNQFEINLANLDPEELLDDMRIYLGDQGGDWKDSMYHDFQYETGRVTKMLGGKMQLLFLKWILQLDIKHNSNSPRLSLPKAQLYFNFNYTRSLEKLYSIPKKIVFYIHGKALDESSQIVLGHGWENHEKAINPKEITHEDFVDGNYATEEDWQFTEAKQYIKNYFKDNYKNAPEIIRKNKRYFKRLRKIEEIYVMGHSMTEVDWKYFETISLNIIKNKVKWTISYYKKEDVENCKKTLELAGIDLKLVQFKRLEDFFSNQGELFYY